MDKVQLGIVGCGTISQLNAPGYLADERCDVVALCDPVAERAQQRAAEWGIEPRIYTSYEQLLNDSDVDAVELLTPTFLHPQQIIDGLAVGKHVSCQKPAANTIEEIRDIAAAVSRADTFYRTTENFLVLSSDRQGAGTYPGRYARGYLAGANPHGAAEADLSLRYQ